MRVIFASFSIWFADMNDPHIRRWPRKLHGVAAYRYGQSLVHAQPAGFFDRNPTLDASAPGGHCHAERHECMQPRVDPGKERQTVG
jgi:hypothetical protein